MKSSEGKPLRSGGRIPCRFEDTCWEVSIVIFALDPSNTSPSFSCVNRNLIFTAHIVDRVCFRKSHFTV